VLALTPSRSPTPWERGLPNAVAYVHPVGAPHMVDPSRLLASASRLYGEMMERLWGEVVPVPEARLCAYGDGEMHAQGVDPSRYDLGAGYELIALGYPLYGCKKLGPQ